MNLNVRTTVWLCVSVALASCSSQGLGERCDTRATDSGNSDCADGLRCTPLNQLNGDFVNTDVCCPADRSSVVGGPCALSVSASNPDDTGRSNGGASSPDAGPTAPVTDATDGSSPGTIPDAGL